MKRFMCLIMVVVSLSCFSCLANEQILYPGVYIAGTDIKYGTYKVLFTGVDSELYKYHHKNTEMHYGFGDPQDVLTMTIYYNTYKNVDRYIPDMQQIVTVSEQNIFRDTYSVNTVHIFNVSEKVDFIDIQSLIGGYLLIVELDEAVWKP